MTLITEPLDNQMQPGILRPYHGPGIDAVTCSNLSARTNEDPFRDVGVL